MFLLNEDALSCFLPPCPLSGPVFTPINSLCRASDSWSWAIRQSKNLSQPGNSQSLYTVGRKNKITISLH